MMKYSAKLYDQTFQSDTVDGVVDQIRAFIKVPTRYQVVRHEDKFMIAWGWSSPLTS